MGNIRQTPLLQKHTIHQKTESINFALSSMCGWRQFMEDNHLCELSLLDDPTLALFAVFDGHGGPQVATFARNHFGRCLVQNGYFLTKNYQRALTQVFLYLDSLMMAKVGQKQLRKILQQNVKSNNANLYEGQCIAGSTANVVLLTKQYIYCANAGDSRAIAILKQSKPTKPKYRQLSTDHKPDEQNEKKRIVKAGGTVADGRINQNLNLSRALGDFTYKKNKQLNPQDQIISACPDIVKVPRKDVSMIVMGCDGVWETKSAEKMTKWMHKKMENTHNDVVKVVQSLLDQEVSKNPQSQLGMDNMTAIVIHLHH